MLQSTMASLTHTPSPNRKNNWHTLLFSSEGKIFIASIILVLILAIVLLVSHRMDEKLFHAILSMTATNAIFGRAAGISFGFASGLDDYTVILVNILIETALVLLIFPLFVWGWNNLLNRKIPLINQIVTILYEKAERHQNVIQKYGLISLFIFVFIPFWATGPTMGCIIGYLMGLSHRKNLLIVLSGTYMAILCWAYLLREINSFLNLFGEESVWFVVIFFILLAIGGFFLSRKKAE